MNQVAEDPLRTAGANKTVMASPAWWHMTAAIFLLFEFATFAVNVGVPGVLGGLGVLTFVRASSPWKMNRFVRVSTKLGMSNEERAALLEWTNRFVPPFWRHSLSPSTDSEQTDRPSR